jgi:outer membrane protein insertion porin family
LWLLFCSASVCLSPAARAQVRPIEVSSLRFEGNDAFGDGILEDVIQTRESSGAFMHFLYDNITEKLGGRPEYYDPVVFEADLVRLRNFYRDNGFFHATVDTVIGFDEEDRTVDLTFIVHEGSASLIDTLRYQGFDDLPSVLKEELDEDPKIVQGDRYSARAVEEELVRVRTAFGNNGYRAAVLAPVEAYRYASTNNITLVITVSRGPRYKFGTVDVAEDTTAREIVDPQIVVNHLDFTSGEFYSEAKKTESERNLNRLGIFESTRIEPLEVQKTDTSIEVPMRVTVRPRVFQEISPEVGANDKDNAFNLFVGLGYNHRNFFGGARNFTIRTRVSVQSIFDISIQNIVNRAGIRDSSLIGTFEITSEMIQPYLFTNKISLTVSAQYMLEKQRTYLADILRGRLGLRAQTARFTQGFVFWDLERTDPEPLTPEGQSDLEVRKDLVPQFNSIITLTLQRDRRDDLFSPSRGLFTSASVEEGGLIPELVRSVFHSTLPYSRYVKLSAVGQWYFDPTERKLWVWAFRLNAGSAWLYGGSTTPLPITRRFYGGGSGSVRAWGSRKLGAVPDPNLGGNAVLEVNLEGRWHLFNPGERFLGIGMSNISLVAFVDAGDVWTDASRMRASEIAIAAGIGFRWDTIAGPLRIDFATRIYDPFAADRQWISERRFFKDTYSLLQFGIGHAF